MASIPTVSVVMTAYNTEQYLALAVDSILAQTFEDFEFIVIDDGSTDRSAAILRDYAARDERIRLTSRPNTGVVRAANEGISLARGKYLARMDSDDISMPYRFARQVSYLEANPEIVCVGGYFELIDECGRPLSLLRPPTTHTEIEEQALAGHGAICHPTATIRHDAMVKIGGYDEEFTFAEDLDLWLRLAEVGQLANLPETILQYRLHDRSVSETYRYEQRRFARLACERAWKQRGIEGAFKAAEPWRPGNDAKSKAEYAIKYGWWAFNYGIRKTAVHYGLRAVANRPFDPATWRLLICSLIKPISKKS
jgi:glycosyltransferase involved in cell wall biosynthesis